MNIREHLGWHDSYSLINREERNLTAILYHVLLTGDNLSRFLEKIKCPFEIHPDEMGIYLEYAYLRDIWKRFQGEQSNPQKRTFICETLRLSNDAELRAMQPYAFNKFFGVGNCSRLYIQSPAEWSIERFRTSLPDHAEFARVCSFKWAFRIKPDLVIHTSNNTAICIEAKLESGEGKYPVSVSEKAEFKRRNLLGTTQTAMQKYLMEELLGLDTRYVFLVPKSSRKSETHVTLRWIDAFAGLDISPCPPFIQASIKRLN
jgi:hypothetical protein